MLLPGYPDTSRATKTELLCQCSSSYINTSCWMLVIYTKARWVPRLRSRPKLVYDQTQSSADPCVPRTKLQGLDGSSSALRSGRWSGDGLIRSHGDPSLTFWTLCVPDLFPEIFPTAVSGCCVWDAL